MSNVLIIDLPWLTLRTKIVQEDDNGILYRTMFDNYVLDNSSLQLVRNKKFPNHILLFFFFLV